MSFEGEIGEKVIAKEGRFGGDEDEMEELPPLPILVNPVGHCIICLRRVKENEGEDFNGNESGRDEGGEDDRASQTGAVSKGRLPLPSGMITTLWAYLMGKEKAAELENVKFISKYDDDVVTELPPVCNLCGEELLELDRLHRELTKKIEDIKKIIKDTAGGGGVNNCCRREGFGKLLRNSHHHLEQGVIRNTFWFMEQLAGSASGSHQENYSEEEKAPASDDFNVDVDWRLSGPETIIPINLPAIVVAPEEGIQYPAVKRKRGRPRKEKLPAQDQPEIKEEVELEEEEVMEPDMLHDNDNTGDEMKILPDSDADCDEEEVKAEVDADDDDDPPKPRRGRVKGRRQKRKRMNPKKQPKSKSLGKANCEVCGAKVSLPDLLQHMRVHVGDFVMKCPNPRCPFAFSNAKSMVKTHLMGGRRKYCTAAWNEVGGEICETCGFSETKGQSFRTHLRLHETATKNIACPFPACEETFTVRQSVNVHISQKHLRLKSSGQCPLCKKMFDMKEMETHLQEQHQVEDVIKCRQCPFVLPDWESYLSHASKHRYDGVPCYICHNGSKFIKNSDLRAHYFQEHQIGKRLVCEQCGWEGPTMDTLRTHHRLKHDGFTAVPKGQGKSFRCDLCEDCVTEFRREEVLVSHKIREHGAEPFACPTCHQTFHSVKHLDRHELEAHAAEKGFQVKAKPNRVFPCDVEGCTQTFPKRTKLTFHKRKCHGILGPGAKPLICEFCSREFFRSYQLQRHRNNIHLGMRKQHMCDTCGEDFTSIHNLNRHKMIHSGERPFSCHLCGQTFRQKGVMETHLKSHETLGDSFKPKGAMERRKRIKREPQCRRSKKSTGKN